MSKTDILLLVIVALVGIAIIGEVASPPPTHAASQMATIVCDNFKTVSSAASVQVVTAGGPNNFVYVCSLGFGSIGGSSWSMVEGTGATCGTNTLAMIGGTTAATGIGIAANGSPFSSGSGVGAITKTAVAGDNVCLIVAGTGPLAGSIASTQSSY